MISPWEVIQQVFLWVGSVGTVLPRRGERYKNDLEKRLARRERL